jgi:hypothetical protein
LKLARLELSNARGETLLLDTDGSVSVPSESESRRVGTLSADGRFVAPDGALIARLSPEGEVFAGDGAKLAVTIDAAGVVHPPNGGTLTFGDDGKLTGGNPNAPETRMQGLAPDNRRTAAFLLVLAGFPTRH